MQFHSKHYSLLVLFLTWTSLCFWFWGRAGMYAMDRTLLLLPPIRYRLMPATTFGSLEDYHIKTCLCKTSGDRDTDNQGYGIIFLQEINK